jgi:hypothetical protein
MRPDVSAEILKSMKARLKPSNFLIDLGPLRLIFIE